MYLHGKMAESLGLLEENLIPIQRCKEVFKKFKTLHSNENRVKFFLKLMLNYGMIPQVCPDSKNAEKSTELRKQGNEKYMSNSLTNYLCIDVLKLYTKSIAYAPCTSEELALAYANRSAVLKQIHKYKECIEDIDRALALPYPNNLRSKLYFRKIQCLSILKHPKTEDVIKEAQNWLDSMSLDDISHKKTNNMFISAKKISVSNTSNEQSIVKQSPLPELKQCNKEVPCASDAITIKYNQKYGRHIVATRDINIGEIIAIEKPYSLILNPNNLQTHCSNCLEVCWANIPCNYCIYAMYCSEECKALGWTKYHDIECKVFPYLFKINLVKYYQFSVRLAIQAVKENNNIQNLEEELKEVENCDDPRTKGFSKNGTFESDAYRSVLSLVTNVEKQSLQDLFKRSAEASFTLYYLATRTDIFGSSMKDLSELIENTDAIFVGGLILRHLQLIPPNAHPFTEEYKTTSVARGVALTPFLSLFNHSCNPNILRVSRTAHIVVYSTYPIKKDEQIFDTYGHLYTEQPKSIRDLVLLTKFNFTCDCVACTENWPLFSELKLKQLNLGINPLLTWQNYPKYARMAREGNVFNKDMIDDLLQMFQLVYNTLQMPHWAVAEISEIFKRVYSLSGNRFDIPEL
ncbi:SET and MYND domain-containing protein 4-like isoform X2 [Osmia bicornis bicornis]|uniref:SET and MYND domain-containing protein 4-like isoform X2 n=1 Tax=Osmia bicornis bicornis TaxID=1437191 RepID=UPI001EAEFB3C|nr:SET and MYND domain-containing protein 4-like isoform X2 [Osmia bicornis bicornis]